MFILLFFRLTGIFTVMCYNVLCDKYATRQMYGYCPSWALSWEYRKKVMFNVIYSFTFFFQTTLLMMLLPLIEFT